MWGRTLVLTVVATLAVGSAVASTVYLDAAIGTIVERRVGDAPTTQTGVSVGYLRVPGDQPVPGAPQSPLGWAQEAKEFLDRQDGLSAGYAPAVPQVGTRNPTPHRLPKGPVKAYVLWRQGQCGQVTFAAGRCPRQVGEIAIAADDAARFGVTIGAALPGVLDARTVRVTGLYRVPKPHSAYWYGGTYFRHVPGRVDPRLGPIPPTIAAFLVSRPTADLLPGYAAGADRALSGGRLDIDRVTELAAAVESAQESFLDRPFAGPTLESLYIETRLPALVAGVVGVDAEVERRALLVGLQLLIIAWYLLYVLVGSNAEQQQAEVALAKLRGHRLRSTFAFALARPGLVVLLAGPLGLVVGLVAMRVGGAAFLDGNAVFELDTTAVAAAGLAVAGGIVASVLALVGVLRDPVADQLRRVRPGTRGRAGLVVGVVVCVLAAAAAWESASLGAAAKESSLGLLAPGLIALALGIVGAQLFVVASRFWSAATFRPSRLAGFLASRQILRRAGSGRMVILVVTTVGLAIFASNAWQAGVERRDAQARLEVGAPLAYPVRGGSMRNLLAATRAADPSARALMGVAVLAPPGRTSTERRLAVDAQRFAAVVAWDPSWSTTQLAPLARGLRGDPPPPVTFRGRELQVQLRDTHLVSAEPLRLEARLETVTGQELTAFFDVVRPGSGAYQAPVPECAGGCRVVKISLDRWFRPMDVRGELVLASLRADGRPVDAHLDEPGRWRPALALESTTDQGPAVDLEPVKGSGLAVRIATRSQTQPIGVTPADVPAVVPAVVAAGTAYETYRRPGPVQAYDGGGDGAGGGSGSRALIVGKGFDGLTQPLRPVARATVLPRLGDVGVLVDLEDIARNASTPVIGVELQVWSSRPVPPEMAKALEQAGVQLGEPTTVDGRRAELATTSDALTLNLYLLCSLAAVILAVTGLGALVVIEVRRRGYELAALRVAGVDRHVLRRAVARETFAGLAPAALCAGAAAVVAGRLASTELRGSDPVGALPAGSLWHWDTFAAVLASTFALLVVVGWLGGQLALRSSDPDQLREGRT